MSLRALPLLVAASCSWWTDPTPPPTCPDADRRLWLQPTTAVPWQHSSTDPTARDPGTPAWFANDDRGHVLRESDEGFVLLEEDGPGLLTRLWSANPERGGVLTVVADGRTVLEGPMDALLAKGPLAGEVGGGFTLRRPIPYDRDLTVRMSENRGKGVYWVAQGLRGVRWAFDPQEVDVRVRSFPAPSLTHHATDRLVLEGPGLVTALEVRFEGPPDRARDLRLTGRFDGTTTVDVPLGGLFGSGTAPAYQDLWRSVERRGTTWVGRLLVPMPVAQHAELAVDGDGGVGLAAAFMPGQVDTPYRFAATHRHAVLPTRPRRDWTLGSWSGGGVLLGETLQVDNPVETWWGGGDEKIRVDGLLHRGTGTEDLFGLAWCNNDEVWGPFGGQPHNARAAITEKTCDHSGGRAVLSRARFLDALPFRHSLVYELGVRHRDDTRVTYDATLFGYVASEGRLER